MAGRRTSLAGLWQLPLLAVALGAFGYAVWMFAYPGPGPTIGEKIGVARTLIERERAERALEVLNGVLKEENPAAAQEAEVRLLIAEAVEVGQRVGKMSMRSNHEAIVRQTRLAKQAGGKLTSADYRRMGESLRLLRKDEDAIEAFRAAVELDESTAVVLERKIIEMQLRAGEADAADLGLERYLELSLPDVDRGWALGERAELFLGKKKFAEARELLGEVLKLEVDDEVRGQTAFRYGWCAVELGDDAEGERQLRLARQLLKVRSPVDAEAAWMLGRIFEKRGKPDEAIAFYTDVVVSHPDSRAFVPSRLGRGVCRVMKGDEDAGLEDMNWVAGQMQRPGYKERHAKIVIEGYEKVEGILSGRQNYQAALEMLGLEKAILDSPAPSFWGRVAGTFEKRADQVEGAARKVIGAEERQQLFGAVRQLRVKAGDACFSYAMSLTLTDNDGYGTELWRAMELYDRAGAINSVIAALELFTQERPSDTLAPEATLRLGKAYMAAGLFDKAITAFQRNQFRYPRSRAASASAVPLAQSLIAKGAAGYARAETVLLGVVEGNPALTPQATEFRNALFELAQLYYRQGRYEEAIGRFDEVTKRYPDEERMGQILFLMADGYRKSAALLAAGEARANGKPSSPAVVSTAGEAVLAAGRVRGDPAEIESARRQRLTQARALFERVVAYHRTKPPARDIDRAQQRLAHFYRADCAFDLGDFDAAIALYDQAAFRYQDDASALAAYVQIVNANVSLGRLPEARTANERAKVLLKRMPPSAFADGSFALSRPYWERWLKWSGESGLWSEK